jgi:hypothetical protein
VVDAACNTGDGVCPGWIHLYTEKGECPEGDWLHV